MSARFALRNFKGEPTAFYRVEEETLDTESVKPEATPSHHVMVIDASGSMYYDLDDLKAMIEKVLTLDEFQRPELRISLISYSSHGDCRLHFERVTVEEVMAPKSPHLDEIRRLHVRGLTGMSQALQMAETLVQDGETTCISLHSDGYANDPSPSSETRQLLGAVKALQAHPGVFVNTMAYQSWADFNTLSGLANALSGVCVQATNIRQVYKALYDTTLLLSGDMAPVLEAGVGDADFLLFVSTKARKVLGSSDNLTVRGLSSGDDATAYRLYSMTEKEYGQSPLPETNAISPMGGAILAFARTQVSLGNLNAAKYALVAYRARNLLDRHYRALAGSDVAAMAADIEKFLFEPTTVAVDPDYGLDVSGPSVLDILGVFSQFASSIQVHVPSFMDTYKRRGIKRLQGVRKDDGSLEKPAYKTAAKNDGGWQRVSGVEINRTAATINLRLQQPVNLVRQCETCGGEGLTEQLKDHNPNPVLLPCEHCKGHVIEEVAGITLDLTDFHNYTIVGDGVLNAACIPYRTSDKRAWKALRDLGGHLTATSQFGPKEMFNLNLGDFPVVGLGQSFDLPMGTFADLLKLTVLQKLLAATLKSTSAAYSAEQVAALKEHNLTPALNFSPPTTTPYTDLKDAIAKGLVDSRPSYQVVVGTPEITDLKKLKSGNAYLQRRFTLRKEEARDDGVEWVGVKKPTLPDSLKETGFQRQWAIKELTARTKLDAVDDLSFPIYEEFLGLADNGTLVEILTLAGMSYDQRKAFDQARASFDGDEQVEGLTTALRQVEGAIANTYQECISPLVFYVGATGLVPDEFSATALTAEQFTEKFPQVKLSKAEKNEGTFFVLPSGLILTVFVKSEHFTTTAGLALLV